MNCWKDCKVGDVVEVYFQGDGWFQGAVATITQGGSVIVVGDDFTYMLPYEHQDFIRWPKDTALLKITESLKPYVVDNGESFLKIADEIHDSQVPDRVVLANAIRDLVKVALRS